MENLNLIPKYDRHHYVKCEACNKFFDCRDLSQVFNHIHDEVPKPQFNFSGKVGEPIIYLMGKHELIQN